MSQQTQAPSADAPSPMLYQHPPGFRLRRAQNWISLGLMYASYYLCRYNLSVVSPELKRDLHFSNTDYGWISSARDGFYGVGQLSNGLFADRIGGKQSMTLGAIGTIVLNLAFGLTAWSNVAAMFWVLFLIRGLDGYFQAFGAPGMVKINAAWFLRRERGGFAGIFGGMIQLGAMGVTKLGAMLNSGFSIPLLFLGAVVVPKLDWRYMFIIPPAIVLIFVVLMNLLVKNHPEQAGYRVVHEDEAAGDDPEARLGMGVVLRKIASNPVVWFVACSYMCTGFVRRAIESWYVIYLDEVWGAGKSSWMFIILGIGLPLSAFLGSLGSGLISDKLVKGRRSPVAAALYGIEFVIILVALGMSIGQQYGWHSILESHTLAMIVLLVLNLTCNSTHSILGTAAAMDLGGRKMSGFSLGLINAFQYGGSVLATAGLGHLFDVFGAPGPLGAVTAGATMPATAAAVKLNPVVWFAAMAPFALLGTLLMGFVAVVRSRTGERGT